MSKAVKIARSQLSQQIELLRTSEGWQKWIKARKNFHSYSLNNQFLILAQCPEATRCRGFRQWEQHFNREVREDERKKPIWILAPRTIKIENEKGEEERRRYFKGVRVWDVSQTDHIEGRDEIPFETPREPIEGNSHAWAIPRIGLMAEEINVSIRSHSGAPDGWFDRATNTISARKTLDVNALVRVLVHELAHAHGVSYDEYGREVAECIADSAAYIVCDQIGLDVSGDSVPYIAAWTEAKHDALAQYADTTDEIATTILVGFGPEYAKGSAGAEPSTEITPSTA